MAQSAPLNCLSSSEKGCWQFFVSDSRAITHHAPPYIWRVRVVARIWVDPALKPDRLFDHKYQMFLASPWWHNAVSLWQICTYGQECLHDVFTTAAIAETSLHMAVVRKDPVPVQAYHAAHDDILVMLQFHLVREVQKQTSKCRGKLRIIR